jgi:hypothetical protein
VVFNIDTPQDNLRKQIWGYGEDDTAPNASIDIICSPLIFFSCITDCNVHQKADVHQMAVFLLTKRIMKRLSLRAKIQDLIKYITKMKN